MIVHCGHILSELPVVRRRGQSAERYRLRRAGAVAESVSRPVVKAIVSAECRDVL